MINNEEDEEENQEKKFLKKHEEEINEVYKKEKAKNIDVDINAIVLERKEAKRNKKRIEAIIKSEKEKWALLKKNQEIKKKKANIGNYDKYIIQEPNQIRILLLGESFSGKTSFIRRFIKNEFSYEYTTTTALQSFKSELLFFEQDSYKIELIDTPPLEKFYEQLNSMLFFVQGVVILFDASSKNSFLRMQDYYKIIPFYNFQKIGIIATKKDICKEKDKYKFHQLKSFCHEQGAIPFFLSVKNSKKEIYEFFNLLCPEIIPSIINRKKEIKLEYPYTKTVKNNFPKENYLDKAIIKKLKEDDSSYESEKEINEEKNKDEIIKNYLIKKEIEKNAIKKKKINTVFNIGNKQRINYDYKNRDFNDVIGQINLDLEKLFRKYRPDSGDKSNHKRKKKMKMDKSKKNDGKNININRMIQDTEEKDIEDKDRDEWVDVNVDELVEQFKVTKEDFNKKINKHQQKEKKEETKKEKDSNKKSEKGKTIIIDNEEQEEKKEKENELAKDNKKEIKENEEIKEKQEIDNIKSKDKEDKEEENEEEKEEENKNKEDEKEEEEEKEKEEDNRNKEEDNLEDENYDNLSDDIQEFQQSLMNEAQ